MSTQQVERVIEEPPVATGEHEAPALELTDAGSKHTPFYLSVRDQQELQRVAGAGSPDAVRHIAVTLERAHRAVRRQIVLAAGLVVSVFVFAASSSVVTDQPAASILDVVYIAVVLVGSIWWIRQERDQDWVVRAVSVMLKTIRVLDDPESSFVRRTRAIDAAAATFYRAFRTDRDSWLRIVAKRAPHAYRIEQRTSAQQCALAIASQGRHILQDPPDPHAAADGLRRAVLYTSDAQWRRVESLGICDDLPPLWKAPGWLARVAAATRNGQPSQTIGGVAALLTILKLTFDLLH